MFRQRILRHILHSTSVNHSVRLLKIRQLGLELLHNRFALKHNLGSGKTVLIFHNGPGGGDVSLRGGKPQVHEMNVGLCTSHFPMPPALSSNHTPL